MGFHYSEHGEASRTPVSTATSVEEACCVCLDEDTWDTDNNACPRFVRCARCRATVHASCVHAWCEAQRMAGACPVCGRIKIIHQEFQQASARKNAGWISAARLA